MRHTAKEEASFKNFGLLNEIKSNQQTDLPPTSSDLMQLRSQGSLKLNPLVQGLTRVYIKHSLAVIVDFSGR